MIGLPVPARSKGRIATAYHEAGHAVAALTYGGHVRIVTIDPAHGATGSVAYDSPMRRLRPDLRITPAGRMKIEAAIIIALAGEIAQRRHRPSSIRTWHGGSDRELAADLALRIAGSGDSATALLKWLEVRAKDLVNNYWPSIERLAAALLDRSTLRDGEIVAAIMPPRLPAFTVSGPNSP
ncbi:hypothetical protein EB232_07700 [Mesorhizobium sp. NZP2077]|nr:hypothetical protein EB232_07700 [Mesorhizobium sp. NZP2077]